MKRYLAILLALALILCSGCGGPKSEKPSVSNNKTDAKNQTYYAPLTGELLDEEPANTRPYAVMINNIIYAQPQVGVGSADMIYEIPAEGGITRMMAIFSDLSDLEAVGSIRSLRPYYLSVALSYDAIVIHGGGSEQAYSDVKTYNADNFDGVRDAKASSAIFYRDSSRGQHGSEHTLFFHGTKVADLVQEYGFRTEHNSGYKTGLTFSDDAVSQCTGDAATIQVTFNTSKSTQFTYQSDSGKYTAVQYNDDYKDGATGEKVAFSNVLVLSAAMSTVDSYGRLAVELTGSGDGYLACGGKYVPIKWSRSSINDCFTYTLADGTPLNLARGTTYVGVVPTNGGSATFA
ncbi:MAG: DUF3048 domain-containing protein [Oscillospiraceae bacterium]|nr:DUF3048 domain-containing protein [Oscillospiraceae bacterium]